MAFDRTAFEAGKCQICQASFATAGGLLRHVVRGHKMGAWTYYTTFGGEQEKCACGKEKKFYRPSLSFSVACSQKCAMTQARARNSRDETYRQNISNAMKEVWKTRPYKSWYSNRTYQVVHADDVVLHERTIQGLTQFLGI